jgi:hypothetical protein
MTARKGSGNVRQVYEFIKTNRHHHSVETMCRVQQAPRHGPGEAAAMAQDPETPGQLKPGMPRASSFYRSILDEVPLSRP